MIMTNLIRPKPKAAAYVQLPKQLPKKLINPKWGFSVDELSIKGRDGRNFKVTEDFTYTAQNGEVITIPIGADTDGLSSPRLIWQLIPPFGKPWKAAVLHDYLYRRTRMSKKRCDEILYEAMLYLKVNKAEAKVIYQSVVLFGGKSFREDRAAQKKAA